MKLKYLFIVFVLIFASCANRKKNEIQLVEDIPLNEINLDYAKGFSINIKDELKILTIRNPWQGAENVEYKYVLANENQKIPKPYKKFKVIRTPIKKVICLSTTHVAFIDVLNENQSIVAISGANYVNNNIIRSKIDNNEVFDIGYDNSLNYELIVSLNPDLVLTYGIGGEIASYNQKLNDLGIQTMVLAEYLENEPLGKLEWIKLLAALYEKDKLASNYYNNAKQEYIKLQDLTKHVINKPKVLFGLPWKDVWYVPGGESYLAKMVEDAGGDYLWKLSDSRESLPFDLESVFLNAKNTDVWLNTGSINNKMDILKIDERFDSFEPYKMAEIFNNNLITNESGGNDYWESGLVNPQLVLKDLIKIFHPEILPNHKLVYYKKIK
ncbi:MAG: ABC transporter substrate-binding protein [Bacteroidales bacterium]|jgi:iron complex transport system substrate-binding protein|nr:ABC transporter substrate-binding protein [Bacteroidales bacterium]